ncbi:Sodium/hydrogen exchanger family-domain-containing protein [Hypoxylon fragiforme]|uniref:Sodium/hydrogen exchanger family-domain-containing protein n=1 Tax=Hypoxylon fragiforme TaxID=63214 RepID=UPI0020C6B6BB|nr:Sodium/hydrogen exchanger family-domain-containing protein [Hypoxylon fragiforme]KAI2610962.1 Sodium/hydrogen exchanger family-domain-containing protein [Hypoxylon fragiforme]
MPTLALTNFNIVVGLLGGWISLFGLVSYLLKESLYLSEALISLLAGLVFSPHATNFIRPLDYAGSEENLDAITLYFTRLVLGVQLVLAGVQLPSRYLRKEWKPLALLLGPVMTMMWLVTSLLVWGLVPKLPFLHALAIAACVTPTDPVLSNVIVKGRFADHNIPKDLQKIIIAESGANDGLGYPFLFFALYLIKYIGDGGVSESGGAGLAIGLWFGETWGYVVILSVVYGAVTGWIAKELLHFCEERKFVDRESFLVFALSLALFIVGTCGMIGSDDILACFIAGNVFTWDDWFRLETLDDSLQPTIDMLLNVVMFMWYGAVCPWHSFVANSVIPIYRLIALGILILLLRRLPIILAFRKVIPQIDGLQRAIFTGFFGPIGCSAIFYLYVTLEFITTLNPNHGDTPRPDVANLKEAVSVLVWFMVICSVVVHGLSIPLGKFGIYLPRTISRSLSSPGDAISSQLRGRVIPRTNSGGDTVANTPNESRSTSARPVFRIGGSVIPRHAATRSPTFRLSISSEVGDPRGNRELSPRPSEPDTKPFTNVNPSSYPGRTIRFPDEQPDSEASHQPEREVLSPSFE